MQEWTDEFITNAQHELVNMVKDWKYDYGADDKACSAMLLWMVLKLNPEAEVDATMLQPFGHLLSGSMSTSTIHRGRCRCSPAPVPSFYTL